MAMAAAAGAGAGWRMGVAGPQPRVTHRGPSLPPAATAPASVPKPIAPRAPLPRAPVLYAAPLERNKLRGARRNRPPFPAPPHTSPKPAAATTATGTRPTLRAKVPAFSEKPVTGAETVSGAGAEAGMDAEAKTQHLRGVYERAMAACAATRADRDVHGLMLDFAWRQKPAANTQRREQHNATGLPEDKLITALKGFPEDTTRTKVQFKDLSPVTEQGSKTGERKNQKRPPPHSGSASKRRPPLQQASQQPRGKRDKRGVPAKPGWESAEKCAPRGTRTLGPSASPAPTPAAAANAPARPGRSAPGSRTYNAKDRQRA